MIWPALILGLAGSLHCAGMCGPLALALPSDPTRRARWLFGRICYNAGRVTTYAAMGLLFGALGRVFVLAGWQRSLSIVLGALLVIGALGAPLADAKLAERLGLFRALAALKKAWGLMQGRNGPGALLVIGLLNGLLPCGLVYAALAGALATGDARQGVVFMIVFGFGTVPMMLSLALAGPWIGLALRRRLQRLIPLAVGALGLMLILRGMDLGIPYLSPKLGATPSPHSCCHP